MKFIQVNCPKCGASIDIPTDKSKVYCVYCGTCILIDDEVDRKEVTYCKIDEAEIVKSNNEVKLREMEYKENERVSKESRKSDFDFLMYPVYWFVFVMAVYLIGKYVLLL